MGFAIYMSEHLGFSMNQLGVTYDPLYGYFQSQGHPEYIWYALTANVLLGIAAIYLFTKIAGEFHEQKE
jgi:hypothetical protein